MPKVVVLCWVCDEKFKNDFAQKAHKNKHWRENIASTSNYDIKSSFNHRQLYITKSNNELIENIKEPLDYILDGSEPNKSYKNKVTVNCLYRKRASEEEEAPPLVPPKNINTNFRREEYMNKDHRLDLNQWHSNSRETYKGYGYDYEFIGVTEMQLNEQKSKSSLG